MFVVCTPTINISFCVMDGLAGVELTCGCWKTSKLHVAPITGLDYFSTWQAPLHFPFTWAADIMQVFEISLKTSAHSHVC